MEGPGLKTIDANGEGDTLNSHGGSVGAEELKGEDEEKETVPQHADGDHDTFQHMTLNQIANMGTKKRKGTRKEKASKKHKNMVPVNTVT